MMSLLAPLILALVLAALCCCEKDSKDPSGSPSAASIKIKREVANAFVRRQKRSAVPAWFAENYKSPTEPMCERCKNYPPYCSLSCQMGFSMAYCYYFGRY
nr:matrix Gla protein-like [Dromaius novaehollandiae]